ncbi:glycosyltransferase family protein [Xylanibacillus composti]|uniref:hypothetical protein n=1 Tax=Xylanibacillus composti TaxID=1572762 RepID=UPI001BCB9108|nr:hypothetical protein [Xylanibacillus composti]
MMKVLHSPIEIAGQMGMLCQGLKAQGVEAIAYNTFHSYLGYREYVFNMDIFELEWMFRDIVRHFDLFHFHYAATLLDGYADLPLLYKAGKPIVMHHWGNDVRTHALATVNNRYAYTGDSPPEEVIDERLQVMTRYIRHAIVQDHEVLPYVERYYEKVHVLPITMDVRKMKPYYPEPHTSNPLIIHAPTNPLFKGTAYVEEAIDQLRQEGLLFRYRRIEKMSNKEALQLYREADIVVDQILCGSYGMLAVESMSLGKPVVGYIRADLVGRFPSPPPICSANPSQVKERLRELITNASLRQAKGREGRRFAETYHDIRPVVRKLRAIYEEILREG